MGFCGNLSGFLDFTNTVDGGSAVNFETDCACLDVWVIEFSLASVSMLMSSTTHVSISSFFERSSFTLRCETVIAWFTICVKLIMAFPFTSLPLSFYTSASRQIMVLVLNKNIAGSMHLVRKRHKTGRFAYPHCLMWNSLIDQSNRLLSLLF